MSIIDNALTPGFDVFDVPRVSNVIDNSYNFSDNILLKKSKNSAESYHSDELTFYGESVILCGLSFAFIFIAVIGIVLKKYYAKSEFYLDERRFIFKVIVVYLFEVLLSSFGIDWLVLEIVNMAITYIIFERYVLRGVRYKCTNPIVGHNAFR